MLDEKAAFVRERLESVKVTQADYDAVIERLAHFHTEAWLDGVLLWLSVCDEWGDADFALPEFAREILRDGAELDWGDEPAPVELYRGNMTTEKLKALWDALNVAHKIETRFIEEHDGKLPSEFTRTLALSMWIEENRNGGSRPAALGNGNQGPAITECPDCGGKVWDNRSKNAERRRDGMKLMPDFKCRDENDCGWKKWPADARKGGKAEKPATRKPEPEPENEPEPVAATGKFKADDDLPF